MKCAACGYDENDDKSSIFQPFPLTNTDVPAMAYGCPRCGVLQLGETLPLRGKSQFNGCTCPWCGNTNPEKFSIVGRCEGVNRFNVACSCGVRGPDAVSKAEAIVKFRARREA